MSDLADIRKYRTEFPIKAGRPDFKRANRLVGIDDLMLGLDALRSDERIAFGNHQNNAQSYIETFVNAVGRHKHPFHRAFQTLLYPTVGIKRCGVHVCADNQRRLTTNRFGANAVDCIGRRQTHPVTGHMVAEHVKTLCWHFDTKPRHEVRFAMANAAKAADISKTMTKTTVKLQLCNGTRYNCHNLKLAKTLGHAERGRRYVAS